MLPRVFGWALLAFGYLVAGMMVGGFARPFAVVSSLTCVVVAMLEWTRYAAAQAEATRTTRV